MSPRVLVRSQSVRGGRMGGCADGKESRVIENAPCYRGRPGLKGIAWVGVAMLTGASCFSMQR